LTSVNDWNLSNTNAKTTNYQCIDLIDTDNKLGVQVTSECGAGKLNDTINCLSKHGMTMHIDKLKVFSLIPGQTSYAVKSTCPGVAFAWEADVLDFDGILRTITNISDLAHLQRIHNFETKSLPTVFATRRAILEASCSQLRENLIVLDREVMWVLECQEDPVLMCRAIRQMRISLQTSGASKIANKIASKTFLAARKVLSVTEMEVKAKNLTFSKWPYNCPMVWLFRLTNTRTTTTKNLSGS
jgi:hypothetical protein